MFKEAATEIIKQQLRVLGVKVIELTGEMLLDTAKKLANSNVLEFKKISVENDSKIRTEDATL